MKTRWIVVAVALTLGAPSPGQAATCADLSGAPDVFDDFEDLLEDTAQDGSETFTLGTTPGTAFFDGDQWRGIAFIPELYFSGARAWMVLENGVGTVNFDPPASEVKFYAKTHSASAGNTVVESLDGSQSVIDTVVLPAGMPSFQAVCLTGSIASLEFINNDVVRMNAVDDFAYIVPEPTSALSAGAGIASLLCLGARARRRRRLARGR